MLNVEKTSMLHRLNAWAEAEPNHTAQRFRKEGTWHSISAAEYRDRVFAIGLYLESIGFTPDDITVILGYNSHQWVHCDLGTMGLGAMSAGIYPNASEKDIEYVLTFAQPKVLCVQDKEYFEKIKCDVPDSVKTIIVFDGDTSISDKAVAYDKVIEEGKKLIAGQTLQTKYLDSLDVDRPAFIIFTSGTTGNPKAAMVSHDNLAYASSCTISHWELPIATQAKSEDLFSFLPLCHIAEKLHSVGVGITARYTTSYCTKFDHLTKELGEVQPTLMLTVPRLWEKMMEGVTSKVANGKGAKKKLAEWALSVGARVADAVYDEDKTPNPLDVLQLKLAEKLVLGKVRGALGLSRTRLAASGAAPLPAHVCRWFRAVGVEINEVYAMTETSALFTATKRGTDSAGTVGVPPEGCELKIADDGEICTRGRHVFKGYYKNEEATRDTLDSEGWLHSGDLGKFDEKGRVMIIGRKREIMKSSGGKMVAPAPIEAQVKAATPIISQICMVGDGRKYFSAVVTLAESKLEELSKSNGALAGDIVTLDPVVKEVSSAIDAVNEKLARFEQIKSFKVLPRDFSIEDGEMTPTMKMKRNIIESNFKSVIDSMYS